ncbi:2-hydroxyacyl-CoA dehydratase family protein [Halodurantibacterium flavum]|uniref:2-hydroxyacyl-CoA dehydratase family protein n=1 Tax=Halodurantibacterium flavum TaxID=1382802 RepID=A0ABW4S3I3_9RHOB
MSSQDAAITAAATLEQALARHDTWSDGSDLPRVGIFGNGVPETLIAAAGALPVHLSFGMTTGAHDISSVIEPFVDEEVRHFLVRLASGAFADYRGIVFARDDAPALIAYQYASEWVRQHPAKGVTPPLFLWNLVHSDSAAVRRFNDIQAGKLFAFLAGQGLRHPLPEDIAAAASDEIQRIGMLREMQGEVPSTISGTEAWIWRNAGRFMPAAVHARLLGQALGGERAPRKMGRRIGLVGSPLACPDVLAMLERHGSVVCDQQGFGAVWPCTGNAHARLDDMLRAFAADPSCPRVTPARAYRDNIVRALLDADCDLVVCQLAQTDDTFGWEIPALSATLAARGITFVNLGFRDMRPGEAWLAEAQARLAQALEARP